MYHVIQITWTHTPNDLLREVPTWSNHGRWGVYDSIMMHAPIFAKYVGPMKVKKIKLKNFESFDITFFIHSTEQHAGMLGWPLKLLNCSRSKVCLTCSMPLCPNGCIFLAFYVPSTSDFLAGIPQGLRPSENTGIMLKSVIHTLSHYTCVLMYITFYVVLKTLKNYTLAVKLSKHWVLYI